MQLFCVLPVNDCYGVLAWQFPCRPEPRWPLRPRPNKRSADRDEELLRRNVLPSWATRKVNKIQRADAATLLDAVVARCLAKDPAKRYSSAGKLAEALHAYLTGFPVDTGQPISRLHRVRKWITRHKPLVALASCLALAVMAFFLPAPDSPVEAEWRKVFGQLPREIRYPGIEKAGPGGLKLDLASQAYELTGSKSRFVEFGNAPGQDFELDVQFDSTNWVTDFGIFLGYDERPYETPDTEQVLGSAQLIWIQATSPVAANSTLQVRRSLEWINRESADLFALDWGFFPLWQPSSFAISFRNTRITIKLDRAGFILD